MSDTTVTIQDALGAEGAAKAIAKSLGEPAWMSERRQFAAKRFVASEWPDRAQHLWRYSDPNHFEPRTALDSYGASTVVSDVPELSEEAKAAGVTVLPLSTALAHESHGALAKQHLESLIDGDFGRIEALNAAVWSQGYFVHVPRGVKLADPVHLTMKGAEDSAFESRRVLAVIEDGADVVLVEDHQGGSDDGVVHGVTEIVVGQAARAEFVLLQRLGEGVNAHLSQRIHLGRDARALTALMSFGAKSSKIDVGTIMAGEGSECETIGLLHGRGTQLFDNHTLHHHTAPHTSSKLDFKVVLDGRSRSAYTGLIGIEKGAPFSEAYQVNRNLLLSDKAKAESIPELEIDIDEVQCSHGATVGPVSQDELFYLMSRGIPEKEAIRQIVNGFLEAILARVPEELAEPCREMLARRLEEL